MGAGTQSDLGDGASGGGTMKIIPPDRMRALRACEVELVRLLRLEPQTPEVRSKIEGYMAMRKDLQFRIFGHDERDYCN
jgi:hypothetical protein